MFICFKVQVFNVLSPESIELTNTESIHSKDSWPNGRNNHIHQHPNVSGVLYEKLQVTREQYGWEDHMPSERLYSGGNT